MIKHLTKLGDDWALVFDREMLRRLNVSGETPLEVTEEGRLVLIAPAESGSEGARFREAFARVKEKYAEALERLAK